MASGDNYLVGWVCALPIEVAAAKATLDRIHDNLLPNRNADDNNSYIFGDIQGHNVVLAYPSSGVYGKTSVAGVVAHLHTSFKSLRYILMVGIAGGVPDTKEDVRLGDVVVSKSTDGQAGVVQYDMNKEPAEDQIIRTREANQPAPLLLTAMGKVETATLFNESKMPKIISEMMRKEPVIFAYLAPEQDVLFEPDYDHIVAETEESGCNECNPDKIRPRKPRDIQDPVVHFGVIASGHRLIRHGATRDKLAHDQCVLCLDTEAAGLKDVAVRTSRAAD